MNRYIALVILLVSGCSQKIQHGLDEVQANEIEVLLNEAGVRASKVREGGREPKWAVQVDSDQTALAVKILSDNDLPRPELPGFGNVFGRGSVVPTSTEETALFLHALSGEVARTLSSVSGVASARVHLVTVPMAPQGGSRPPVKPRAAVLLKARHGKATALDARRGEIQALVAGSVEGLEPDDVAVMISEAPPLPLVTGEPPPASSRWLLLVAALAVTALSGGLAITVLHSRRLRLRLSRDTRNPPASTAPGPAKPACGVAP